MLVTSSPDKHPLAGDPAQGQDKEQLEHIRPCCWLQEGGRGLCAWPDLGAHLCPAFVGEISPSINPQWWSDPNWSCRSLVVANAPGQQHLGSASPMGEKGNLREQHKAASGQVQVGCWEKLTGEGLHTAVAPRGSSRGPRRAGYKGEFGRGSQKRGLDFRWSHAEPGVGLSDPRGSLP